MAAIHLMLVVMGCAVVAMAQGGVGDGPCFAARANKKDMPGAYMPQCEPWGDFKAKQCHSSTGYCWCVTAEGTKVSGTETSPGQDPPNCAGRVRRSESGGIGGGPCFTAVANTKQQPGAYMPQCEPWGDFKAKQCHSSTGYCWCVTAEGTKVSGTETGPGQDPPNCA